MNDRRICETAEQLPINDGWVETLARNGPDSEISNFAGDTVEDWRAVPTGGDDWEENLNEAAANQLDPTSYGLPIMSVPADVANRGGGVLAKASRGQDSTSGSPRAPIEKNLGHERTMP